MTHKVAWRRGVAALVALGWGGCGWMEPPRPPPAPVPVALLPPTRPRPPPPLSPPSLDGTGTVQVRVVSTREARPLPGVTVALFREPSGLDAPPERTGSTDEAGRAVFAELRAGVFTVCARGAQHPEVCNRGGVVAGGTLSLEPRLAPGAVVVGQVLRADGSPAADVQLTAQANLDPGLEERMTWALEARTDAEGRYRLEGLPPGELWLRSSSPEGQGPSHAVEGLKEGEETRFDFRVAGFTPVTVRRKPTRARPFQGPLVIDRSRPATFFELAGHVRMPDGTPAVGAWSSALRARTSVPARSTVTGCAGLSVSTCRPVPGPARRGGRRRCRAARRAPGTRRPSPPRRRSRR